MKSEKQAAAARANGKLGGRPRTGKTPQIHITFPADWVERLDAARPADVPRCRWIMEKLKPLLK